MPRPKRAQDTIQWYVVLPETLAEAVERQILDPLSGRPRYGARSRLIERLLRDWLKNEQGVEPPPMQAGGPAEVYESGPQTLGELDDME